MPQDRPGTGPPALWTSCSMQRAHFPHPHAAGGETDRRPERPCGCRCSSCSADRERTEFLRHRAPSGPWEDTQGGQPCGFPDLLAGYVRTEGKRGSLLLPFCSSDCYGSYWSVTNICGSSHTRHCAEVFPGKTVWPCSKGVECGLEYWIQVLGWHFLTMWPRARHLPSVLQSPTCKMVMRGST